MGLIRTELVERHEKDSIVDVVEPGVVDKVQIDWVYTAIGTATLVVAADSTPMVDEHTTRVMVLIHDDMNRMWCVITSTLGGG